MPPGLALVHDAQVQAYIWGNAKWRGNCSGYIYRHLFQLLTPQRFCDPMVGSGTSVDVAREMGIEAVGLDLHSGFNVLSQPIRLHLPAHWNGQADLCFSHPPYHTMVTYSGAQWGNEAHPDDLSRCSNLDEFYEKLALALLNQRDSVKVGGIYGTLLGDLRQKGAYHALASDIQAYLPRSERRAILIKAQHNTQSGTRTYSKLRFGRIEHEYILLYERQPGQVYAVLAETVQTQQETRTRSWKAIIGAAILGLGETFTTAQAYQAVMNAAPERIQQSEHWQAKVRQTLQQLPGLTNPERGVWARAA
ncbi:hypothetical protein EJ104_13195 [Deinococcus radiophilus]|uniref:DNA methylase N-4/N-6 domain-containing protein n=2 Tax=Deinococcus radiophilus TaxID=32062 RepID=A0A431VIJ3_9DEIO|nr:hypothetical protein EJ104_13195 [Deinococcus radiophilus]